MSNTEKNPNEEGQGNHNVITVGINNAERNDVVTTQNRNLVDQNSTKKKEENTNQVLVYNTIKKEQPYRPQEDNGSCFQTLISLTTLAIEITIIVMLAYIYKWTDKNPIENIIIPSNTMDTPEANDGLLNPKLNLEAQNSAKNKNLFRYLGEDCEYTDLKLEKNNYEFDKVFKFKYNIVHKMALGLLITFSIYLSLLVLIIISTIGIACCKDCCVVVISAIFCLIIIVTIVSGISNLVLTIIMMVNYFKSDNNEFLDYYEQCMSRDKKLVFESVHDRIKKLKAYFITFIVLYFVDLFINFISKCCNKKKEK